MYHVDIPFPVTEHVMSICSISSRQQPGPSNHQILLGIGQKHTAIPRPPRPTKEVIPPYPQASAGRCQSGPPQLGAAVKGPPASDSHPAGQDQGSSGLCGTPRKAGPLGSVLHCLLWLLLPGEAAGGDTGLPAWQLLRGAVWHDLIECVCVVK